MEPKSTQQQSNVVEASFMGACVTDLTAFAARFPKPGETVSGKHFKKGNGGKAANACVMAAKLGLGVQIVAKLGNDAFGNDLFNGLKMDGVNTDNVFFTSEAFTATALICVTDSAQNSIVYTPGAANELCSTDIQSKKDGIFKDVKLFVSTFECKPETLMTALRLAKNENVTTLVNGAPPFTEKFDKSLIGLCDIFCVNETEAYNLTGKEIKSMNDAKNAVLDLLAFGCSMVIITLGENGAVFASKDDKHVLEVPSQKVKAVDTTGAGDAFVGALAYFFVREPNLPFAEKIRRSCFIASVTTEKEGTQTSFPSKCQLPKELFYN